ncbi:hypothetical protein KP509_05G067800 [Ceratopteris richardii]|uniref:Uncharacterized protein n=2 Tax=Ceratopteris richardii TaxID=49495 RepID=A0A8T2UUB8_CERRI|nr:hypothetical protein KP509_05G067800 [Ceratopteris richardii]
MRLPVVCFSVFLILASIGVGADSDADSIIKQVTDVELESSLSGIPISHISLREDVERLFERFIEKFGKNYASMEEKAHRFRVFERNVMKAAKMQRHDPTAIHGVTKFSDLTEKEFSSFLGLKTPRFLKRSPGSDAPILPTNDLPDNFDWREHGAVSEVKNQGTCGSCWTFSTTGAVEGAYFVKTGKLLSLSEQQLVDCDHECDPKYGADACDSGCNGGLMTSAYGYIHKAGGLQLEADYPYKGVEGTCKFDPSKVAAKVSNFSTIVIDEAQIAANLVKNGPLAIGLNAAFMQTYIGGVSCPYICSKRRIDHGVLLVGYGEAGYAPARLKEKPYWIIKNSWGPSWGEGGYYKICQGHNECGVNSMVSTVAAAIVE